MRLVASIAALSIFLGGCSRPEPKPSPAVAAEQPKAPPPQKYAVIVNGDIESEHRTNVSRAYAVLRGLGFEERNLFVLSPKQRRRTRAAKAIPASAPSAARFARVMAELAKTARPGDLVVIYCTGHGDTWEGQSLLDLRSGDLLATELRADVERLPSRTVIIMDQCFSGGFADAFAGTKGKILIVTTVDGKHETYCAYFAEAFWSAFLHPERADTNHDGKTSVREAFQAAIEVHKRELAGDPDLKADGDCRGFNGLNDATLN